VFFYPCRYDYILLKKIKDVPAASKQMSHQIILVVFIM